jgi:hypothetical protein
MTSDKQRWNLERSNGVVWSGLIWLGIEISGWIFKCGNELSDSIKFLKIHKRLRNW